MEQSSNNRSFQILISNYTTAVSLRQIECCTMDQNIHSPWHLKYKNNVSVISEYEIWEISITRMC